MKRRIQTALRDQGSILCIGVDPAMATGCGIAVIRYWPDTLRTEPVITRTFKPLHPDHVVEYLGLMRDKFDPEAVAAMGVELSYRGRFMSIPYALGKATGIVIGIASAFWPGIVVESFKASEWRLLAFGDGRVSKAHAMMLAQADFNKWPDAEIIGELTEDAAEAYYIARATAHKVTET